MMDAMNPKLRTALLTISREVFEPFLALKELVFPEPHRVTLLEKLALARKGAIEAHVADPIKDAEVIGFIHELSEKMHLKTPKIVLYHSDTKQQAMHINNNTVALGYQKIANSTPDELRATIAHELAHQHDNSVSLAVSIGRVILDWGVKIGCCVLAHHVLKPTDAHPSMFDKIKQNVASIFAFACAGPLTQVATEAPYAAFRRQQELNADATAGKVVGYDAMESVLEKKIARDQAEATEHLPTTRKKWVEHIEHYIRTHPSFETRIAALETLEEQEKHKAQR
ncbi:MAG: hypothetical protein EAY65_00060 [Alphaproteobacteria bacterium]|nr:MAG: hypothetical protein EAY65_00060 [Alphaproteobacteria bacterium]